MPIRKSKSTYVESNELKELAKQLKLKYHNIIDYVDLEKIFFAFKGDAPDFFEYGISGASDDWYKYSSSLKEEVKTYCISVTYDFYTKAEGPLMEWVLLDMLYTCGYEMDGKLRGRKIKEHSTIATALEDLGETIVGWRENHHLPSLLGEETIFFNQSNGEENESL